MDKIKLVDAIANLRREIQEANAAAQGEALQLTIEDIEVDFGVEIERTRKGDAKLGGQLSFSVLSVSGGFGGSMGKTKTATHSIRLRLRPSKDGSDVPVSDRTVREP